MFIMANPKPGTIDDPIPPPNKPYKSQLIHIFFSFLFIFFSLKS